MYQNAPYLTTDYSVFPTTIENKSAWNSYWTQTVRFADGTFDDVFNAPWPGFASKGHHLWIQEDAWGNCTYFSS